MKKAPTDAAVQRQATAAANRRKKPAETLTWSQALADADPPDSVGPAWVSQYRKDYAARLVVRGYATKAAPSGSRGAGGTTDLRHRKVYQTQEEFDEQDALAEAAGLKWSSWARRKLGTKKS